MKEDRGEKASQKKGVHQARDQSQVNIGAAFPKWRAADLRAARQKWKCLLDR